MFMKGFNKNFVLWRYFMKREKLVQAVDKEFLIKTIDGVGSIDIKKVDILADRVDVTYKNEWGIEQTVSRYRSDL